MELQAVLVLCGLGVAGAAVLLLMGLFSTSGTSYEDAVAQQRKATTELLALAENKGKPKKSAKKANKKQAKKEKHKDSVSGATGSEPESEAPADSGVDDDVPAPKPHVDFSPPVVVDIPRDAPPNVKAEKKEEVTEKKINKAKGKQGKAAVAVAAAAPEPAKEEPALNSVEPPKDQRKGKKDKRSVDDTESTRDAVPPPAPQPSELTTEKLLKQALAALPAHAAPPAPPAKPKKKKQEPSLMALIAADGGGVNVSELVRLVREAALSRTEIQVLTDALLNKQHDPLPQHSEWSEGPNDPMQKMKKQLAEKEKALADELEASQALHAKLKELRSSLNAERARATAMARAADEAAGELRAAHARLQRATDDHHALSQEKLMLQSKLSAEGEAQAQRVQMELHIQRLSESEAALVGQLQALQAEAAALAHEAATARCEAAAARDAALIAQQHAADLAQQLADANRVCAELDAQRLAAQQDARNASERLPMLAELQGEVQRLSARAQLADAAEAARDDADRQRQQLAGELSALREQLAAREAELAEAKALRPPALNGLPAPDAKASELSKVEGVVSALRGELAAAQSDAREQRAALAQLHDQLRAYQDKNNDLRTKNWKVMEALQSAEKALQSKPNALPVQDSLSEALAKAEAAQYSEVAALLGAACPTAAPKAAPSKAWLKAFADALRTQLEAKAPAAPAAPAAPTAPAAEELRAQNQHLQGLVDKYKRIIDDTEGVLSRLQQNVTSEERRWAQQLQDKQRELDELRQRTVTQMQGKIDALEAELRRGSHRHILDGAATEDRLLADLSKNKLDSSNGPLQVSVEEK